MKDRQLRSYLEHNMKSDHEALEAERHESAKMCDQIGRLREDTRQLRVENVRLATQLAQFHAAMERDKDPKWSGELRELADELERDIADTPPALSTLHQAARQLRSMADEFVHKANFVPMQNRIRELEQLLSGANDATSIHKGE